MSAGDIAKELRVLASQADSTIEFVAINEWHIDLFIRAAAALEQSELQRDSAIAVSRKLQDEREELLARVEAALLGIQSVESRDEDEEDTRRS